MGDLHSISVPLWILAALSILQVMVLVVVSIWAYTEYSRVRTLVKDLEARQIEPIREKVDAILADVKSVTALASHQAERVDHAINGTIERVDETTARVRAGVHERVRRAAGVVRGVRAVITSLLSSSESPA
jgi:hypothetical protein